MADRLRAGGDGHGRRPGHPAGLGEQVDPRTAERVPLTMSLRDGVPLYPGDPAFSWEVAVDTRTPQHDDGGYLLERITSPARTPPATFRHRRTSSSTGPALSQLDEGFTLMPLAVIDLRDRIRTGGSRFLRHR